MSSAEDTRIHSATWQSCIGQVEEATRLMHDLWMLLVAKKPHHRQTIAKLSKCHRLLGELRDYIVSNVQEARTTEAWEKERQEEKAAAEKLKQEAKERGEGSDPEIPF